MSVLKERRFRDMRLTESDVEERIHANSDLCERKIRWDCDHLGVGDELDNTELVAFVDRAKRLLPLWRDIGLKRLKREGIYEGYVCGVIDAKLHRGAAQRIVALTSKQKG